MLKEGDRTENPIDRHYHSLKCDLQPMDHKSDEFKVSGIKWASMRENLSSGVWEQQRRRPACASTQSDQRPCYSLFGNYHIKACHKRNFNCLASPCSLAGWFESHFDGNPEDKFCCYLAQIIFKLFSRQL